MTNQADPNPFFFPRGDRAVLCVHGFTGSPYEMRFLGERLHQAGFTVLGIRLPGHRSPEELASLRYEHWTGAVEAACARLEQALGPGAPVGLAGLSMGGTLVINAAAKLGPRVKAVALFSTPLNLSSTFVRFLEFAE